MSVVSTGLLRFRFSLARTIPGNLPLISSLSKKNHFSGPAGQFHQSPGILPFPEPPEGVATEGPWWTNKVVPGMPLLLLGENGWEARISGAANSRTYHGQDFFKRCSSIHSGFIRLVCQYKLRLWSNFVQNFLPNLRRSKLKIISMNRILGHSSRVNSWFSLGNRQG